MILEIFKKIVRVYVFGNIHISIIAGACFYFYNNRIDQAIIVLLTTFFYYNFCSIIYMKDYDITIKNDRLAWVSNNLTEVIVAMMGVLVVGVFLWIKCLESKTGLIDLIPFVSSIALCFGYFFIRHISILKNIVIASVWILVMHIWKNWEASLMDIFLLVYLTFVSISYDRTRHHLKKLIIDTLIVIPFLGYFLAVKYHLINIESIKP
ncbi:MAG: hypothetical protein ACK4VL_04405 [Chitinophagales bacterium]